MTRKSTESTLNRVNSTQTARAVKEENATSYSSRFQPVRFPALADAAQPWVALSLRAKSEPFVGMSNVLSEDKRQQFSYVIVQSYLPSYVRVLPWNAHCGSARRQICVRTPCGRGPKKEIGIQQYLVDSDRTA